MTSFTERINKYISRYLSTRVVFVMDVLLSTFSTIIVYLVSDFIIGVPIADFFGFVRIVSGSFFFSLLSIYVLKSYRLIIRHLSAEDILRHSAAAFLKVLLLAAMVASHGHWCLSSMAMLVSDFIFTLFLLISARVLMIVIFGVYREHSQSLRNTKRILVFGTGDKSISVVSRFANSSHFNIIGFLNDGPSQMKIFRLADKPVYNYTDVNSAFRIVEEMEVDSIIFATDKDAKSNQALIEMMTASGKKALIVPEVNEVSYGKVMKNKIRDVKIEDLLGREEIEISMKEICEHLGNKVIMVTGAAGSIGSEICRQVAVLGVKKLILFDNSETPMHNLRLELEERFPHLDFVPVIGDVRHPKRLDFAFRKYRPQIIFHAAAYKHVPLMEENPCEAVLSNCIGTRNLADKCIEYAADKMVMISTDKAVNPTNIMGCSKRIAEIYVQSLGLSIEKGETIGHTRFVTTRFGNVLGSNGSVIPRFREQISKGGPVTVTHPDINRFFMTIPEACRLVLEAASMSKGNEIFVFDMGESVKIDTLARRMIKLAGFEPDVDIKIEYTGLRPGEKLYEEVLSDEENTKPTSHNRIRIAKVREYDYNDADMTLRTLENLSRSVDIDSMVKLMKSFVPEYISQNSRFSEFDK